MVKSICKTHLMILGMVLAATITIEVSEASQALDPLIIAKNADGSVKRMNQTAAYEYCYNYKPTGHYHLPSAYEFALLAMSHGAKGIVNECDSSDNECQIIKYKTEDGTGRWVIFHYSYAGYHNPAAELQGNWFWSATSHPYKPYDRYKTGLSFDSGSGSLDVLDRTGKLAVLCLLNH